MVSANITNGSSNQQNTTCHITIITKDDFPVQICKIVFLSTILLVSLIANTLVIVVVCKGRELRKTVNFFIVNMAVSDFVFPLIGIPATLAGVATNTFQWFITGTAGSIMCKLSCFLQRVSVTVSIQSLLWIALDRFLAVVFPMKIHPISSRSRTYAIASTWVVAVILNARDFYTFGLQEFNGYMMCIDESRSQLFKTTSYVYIVLVWISPLIVITILYCAIAVTLRKQGKFIGRANVKGNNQRKNHAIKMSFCIVIAFYLFALLIITMLCFQAFGNYSTFADNPTYCSLYNMIWFVSYLGLYLGSTTNPVICFSFVGSYRRGLKEIFCRRNLTQKTWNIEEGKLEEVTLKRITRRIDRTVNAKTEACV